MTDAALRPRNCGPCNACCKLLDIEALAKPAGVLCGHVKAGMGCGIYADRPSACRAFECQWIMQPDLPHKYRPDQCKVMLSTDSDGARLIAHCEPTNPMAWKRQPMYALLKDQARRTWGTGSTILAKAGLRMWLIAPDEDVDLGEVPPGSPFQIETGADGRIKVTVLSPPAET